jgi:probable sporulation protein (polysaccharide deacetylase family)
MKKRPMLLFVIVSFLMVSMLFYQIPTIDQYVDYVSGTAYEEHDVAYFQADDTELSDAIAVSSDEDVQLLERIKRLAEEQRIEPIDAKVDPVWKAIPGYNGKELDVEKTYKLSRNQDKIRPIYVQTSPRIQLDDLGAHPIYKGNSNKKMVSIMINVAWGNEYLPVMLETLKAANVKATFFLDGSWLSKNVKVAKQMVEAGHEIGNHAYSHKNMSTLNRNIAYEEIHRTQKLIEEELGLKNTLFAPPSGDYDEETVQIAHEMKLKTILWTLDTVDWKKPEPSWIIKKITTRLEPGALILMHPTESSSKALPELIRNIKNKGLVPGTVSELLSPERLETVESALYF